MCCVECGFSQHCLYVTLLFSVCVKLIHPVWLYNQKVIVRWSRNSAKWWWNFTFLTDYVSCQKLPQNTVCQVKWHLNVIPILLYLSAQSSEAELRCHNELWWCFHGKAFNTETLSHNNVSCHKYVVNDLKFWLK